MREPQELSVAEAEDHLSGEVALERVGVSAAQEDLLLVPLLLLLLLLLFLQQWQQLGRQPLVSGHRF